jgi:hypothetical protein
MPTQTPRQPVRQEWPLFFRAITEQDLGKPITIEVVSPELGTNVEADGMPLEQITYDDRDDAVIITVASRTGEEGALRHIVEHPWKIIFDPPSPTGVRTIDIEGPDGSHTLVTLHSRPAVPEAD